MGVFLWYMILVRPKFKPPEIFFANLDHTGVKGVREFLELSKKDGKVGQFRVSSFASNTKVVSLKELQTSLMRIVKG